MNRLIFLIPLIILIAGCTNEVNDNSNNTQIANPSATYCVEQGYTYDIRNTADGQVGYCIFDNNTECIAWEYFRGECTIESASPCKNLCGDGECQETTWQETGDTCSESNDTCAIDCSNYN